MGTRTDETDDDDEVARRVAVLDDEIRRLHEHAKTTPDVFAHSLDRAQIDELLEPRHHLTNPDD